MRRRARPASATSSRTASERLGIQPTAPYDAFIAVIERDARSAQAAVQLVLAQPSISSQLVDNLNASIHLRALLTDLFLIDEVLKLHGSSETLARLRLRLPGTASSNRVVSGFSRTAIARSPFGITQTGSWSNCHSYVALRVRVRLLE